MQLRALAAFLLAALVSLAAPCGAARSPDAPLPISVTVEEVPAEDVWRVGYVLPRAVPGVEFVTDRNAFRAERWSVGLREGEPVWHRDGGRERLCFTVPTRTFSVGFRTWTDPLPKDYELNVAFSEASRLLYTGHLRVRPLATCGETVAEPLPGHPEHRFTFTTIEGRGVWAAGEVGTGEVSWAPGTGPAGERLDTYAYFGNLPPVESPLGEQAATLLLDPGLPDWMRRDLADDLLRLAERFADLTGTPLPFRPLLLVSWDGAEGSGRSFSGGTLPGLLLAAAGGEGWLEPDGGARGDWLHRLGHELFHLWNGEAYRPDPDAEWLSEGAADHFAVGAAVALGGLQPAAAERWWIERANDCALRLGGRSLVAVAGSTDYAAWYSCGAVAVAAADGALRRGVPPSDAGRLFGRLFEHAAATGSYGAAAFLGGLRELGADPPAVDDLRRLIGTGAPGSAGPLLLQRLLAHAGLATTLAGPDEAALDPETFREIVRRAVGRCWCGAEADSGEEDAGCDPAASGAPLSAVAGHDLHHEPVQAWRALTDTIARGAALETVLDGLDTTLFCTPESLDPSWQRLLAPAPAPAGAPEPPR